MSMKFGDNDKISGVIAGWSSPFETTFVAHLNGDSGFNSTVGFMSGSALLKVTINQDLLTGETYEIGPTDSDAHQVRLEIDIMRSGEEGTYFATSGNFKVLQLENRVLNASFDFKASTRGRRQKEMDFSSGAFKVEDFKHT